MQDDDSNPVSTERFAVGRTGGSSTRCARLACAVLRPGLLLFLLAPGAMALPASGAAADAAQIVCPALLLDHECRAYKADLSSAPSVDARDALKTHYEGLLFERERACYCNPERSWIRLSESASDRTIFRPQ